MIYSLQAGLDTLPNSVEAALIALGDQPQINKKIVSDLLATYQQHKAPLVIPSYQMRRGHPWIITRSLWRKLIDFDFPVTMRDFLNQHAHQIHYLPVDTDIVLRDLDTPADYHQQRPTPKDGTKHD
jgi:molybdenum cofactor cytidylyltransferase